MKPERQNRLQSFYHAFHGIWELAKTETNFKIELVFAILALLACCFFQVEQGEWIAVILCCATVLALEGMNTAVEKAVDLVTEEPCKLARQAKDFAAGAVLLAAIGAAGVGLLIFLPYLLRWLPAGFVSG